MTSTASLAPPQRGIPVPFPEPLARVGLRRIGLRGQPAAACGAPCAHVETTRSPLRMADLVFITGGAGFIGAHLASGLLERGCEVRVLDDLLPQVHGECERPPYLA